MRALEFINIVCIVVFAGVWKGVKIHLILVFGPKDGTKKLPPRRTRSRVEEEGPKDLTTGSTCLSKLFDVLQHGIAFDSTVCCGYIQHLVLNRSGGNKFFTQTQTFDRQEATSLSTLRTFGFSIISAKQQLIKHTSDLEPHFFSGTDSHQQIDRHF